jgi:hypothetical protein
MPTWQVPIYATTVHAADRFIPSFGDFVVERMLDCRDETTEEAA